MSSEHVTINVIRTCHNLRQSSLSHVFFFIFLDSRSPLPAAHSLLPFHPPPSYHLLLPSGASAKHCVLKAFTLHAHFIYVTTVISNWRLSVCLSVCLPLSLCLCLSVCLSLFLSFHPVNFLSLSDVCEHE